MSSFDKYRIHEVAKDFNTTSKVISEILTEYVTAPKNHMQVLEDAELDVIFEYLTQQIRSAALRRSWRFPRYPRKRSRKQKRPGRSLPLPGRQRPHSRRPPVSSLRRKRRSRNPTCPDPWRKSA